MNKNIYIIVILLLMCSCSDFLETEPLTNKVNTNFYQTPEDVNQALIGIYSVLNPGTSPMNSFFISELMSDDRFGGGGGVDAVLHAISEFRNYGNDMYLYPWQQNYKGIFRCNMLLESFDQVQKWESEIQKNRYEGEALFMRAYYYFDLARMFGTVPLVLETKPQNLPKATPDELFSQIASDLLLAIQKLPDTPYSPSDIGRVTKWVAQGMLARVFLYYTGVYGKTEIVLPESGTLTKSEVINNVDYCIENSGHKLVDDFRNLWPYSYADNYNFTQDNNLSWVGEEGNNSESMFSIRFGSFGGSSRNTIVLYFGLRMQNTNPFGYGWGVGPVNPQLWNSWEDLDLRKKGSICDVKKENIGYVSSSDQYHESYLWQKKYMPVNIKIDGKLQSMYTFLYGTPANNMNCNAQEIVLMRLADVYLMGAELGSSKAQEYLDVVRARVNLPSVPVTLDNIKKERRHELAFEGVRYYDLMRWGELETAFNKLKNIPLENEGKSIEYSVNYRPETKGYLPIPESQILLSGGILEQNEGW
ncbi:MAG: RagB/SusD family nutrient uptake outer membrane protein [Dysgonomonadaceae bacterium]|nr:RagB/SusD family nutrient uptake outer membrane protein [Dysgonamonadaceae bacterium]